MPTNEGPTATFEGGPRDGQDDTLDAAAPIVGTGEEGGVYQRTNEQRNGLVVYRWQQLTEAEVNAIVRGDLRASQDPD
jgi:hypothetical protein